MAGESMEDIIRRRRVDDITGVMIEGIQAVA